MNKYFRGIAALMIGLTKRTILKITCRKRFKCNGWLLVSPRTEITIDKGGSLFVGKKVTIRSGSKIRIRRNAKITIGDNFSMSNNCVITAHEEIVIGNNVQFGPGVLLYDHDHDYMAEGGLPAEQYKTKHIKIGSEVWIGANSIILRGTEIGSGCVVAAGSILKGKYPDGVLIYQKKETSIKQIK